VLQFLRLGGRSRKFTLQRDWCGVSSGQCSTTAFITPLSQLWAFGPDCFLESLAEPNSKGKLCRSPKDFPTTLTHRVPRTRSTTRHASTSLNMRISQLWAFGPDCFLESLAELLYGFHQKLSFPLLLVIREPFL
jgi:hypothetical protein